MASILLTCGCCPLAHEAPGARRIVWQDPRPPTGSLAARATAFQERLLRYHRTPSGVLRYRRTVTDSEREALRSYGDLADGCFHTGIYLASQAMRYRATGEPEARVEMLHALRGLELLMEVTGTPGLLARHLSPVESLPDLRPEKWRRSEALPRYVWRPDVSKDQYAGFVHGLGVTLSCVDDSEVRRRIAALAGAAATHLRQNDLRIVDVDGEPTTFGDLRGRLWGIPKGVDALIVLAIAKVAAVSTGSEEHESFYRSLVERGYPELTCWAYIPGLTKRVNDHMGYLALYPLLLLEDDPAIVGTLRRGARRSWRALSSERNAFFAWVHGAVVGAEPEGHPAAFRADATAIRTGREALGEFPAVKVEWPVDLTRPGFDFPRRLWRDGAGHPRSRESVPLYLRTRGSSLWVGDPYRMVGRLGRVGQYENSGVDFLAAYWLGRRHGFLTGER